MDDSPPPPLLSLFQAALVTQPNETLTNKSTKTNRIEADATCVALLGNMLLATNVLLTCSLPLSLSLSARLASSAAQVKWRNASKTLEPLRQLRRVANTKLWLSSELNFPTCGRLCFPTRLRRSEKRRYSFSFRAPRAVKIVAVPLRMRSSKKINKVGD